MSNGQAQQIRVCDLPVSDKEIGGNATFENADIILPKGMGGLLGNFTEQRQCLLRGDGFGNDLRVRRDSYERTLSQRTRCPPR